MLHLLYQPGPRVAQHPGAQPGGAVADLLVKEDVELNTLPDGCAGISNALSIQLLTVTKTLKADETPIRGKAAYAVLERPVAKRDMDSPEAISSNRSVSE